MVSVALCVECVTLCNTTAKHTKVGVSSYQRLSQTLSSSDIAYTIYFRDMHVYRSRLVASLDEATNSDYDIREPFTKYVHVCIYIRTEVTSAYPVI